VDRSERRGELAGSRKALGWLFAETAHHDGIERSGQVWPTTARTLGLRGEDLRADLSDRVGRERRLPNEKLVEGDAERPYVGTAIDRARFAHLLGRHIERRAHEGRRAREGCTCRAARLRDAEVEDLDRRNPVGASDEKNVGGLQIAMNDSDRVRLGNRVAGLDDDVDHLGGRKRAASTEDPREILAYEQLHDHIGRTVLEVTYVVHASNMVTEKRGGSARLPLETHHCGRIAHRLRQ